MLPADAADLRAKGGEGSSSQAGEKTASSKDPAQAEREQAAVHGVAWGMSYEQALEQSKANGKPILIDFTGVNCANCRLMEQEVLPRPDVIEQLGQFVTIQLYTDFVPIDSITADQREALAEKNLEREVALTSEATNPFYVALNSDGKVIGTLGGKRSPAAFIEFLKGALARHGGTSTTAPATAAR